MDRIAYLQYETEIKAQMKYNIEKAVLGETHVYFSEVNCHVSTVINGKLTFTYTFYGLSNKLRKMELTLEDSRYYARTYIRAYIQELFHNNFKFSLYDLM